jgi:hypothetical protein
VIDLSHLGRRGSCPTRSSSWFLPLFPAEFAEGPSRLHLKAKRRSCRPELVHGLGEDKPGSVLGRREILRGLVGDPGRLELRCSRTRKRSASRSMRPSLGRVGYVGWAMDATGRPW